MTKLQSNLLKIGAVVTYLVMITVNSLANSLPLNGLTTGAVSNAYSNLFAPAGITFSIWGLIYVLLAVYLVFQFIPQAKGGLKRELVDKINPYFIATSLLNTAWIFAWHYNFIGVSLILMVLLLISLIKIATKFRLEKLSIRENLAARLPFSIYFGWITVATIANTTVFLVSLGWNGFGLSNEFWLVLVLLIGAAIGIWRMNKERDHFYGLVFIWAYLGILYKHLTSSGFSGQYHYGIGATILCLVALAASQFLLARTIKKLKRGASS